MQPTHSGRPDTDASAPACSAQVILFSYQPKALAEEIFGSAAELATRRPGLQVVLAWGGGAGLAQDTWAARVADWRERGADAVLVSHAQPLHRTRLALAQRKDWILPVADDDPVAVNYLRVMIDATARAADDVCAIVPSNHVQNYDTRTLSTRLSGWPQASAAERLLRMLSEPGAQGAVFWAAYRQPVFSSWLEFGLSLPFQPAYLDQFLPHLAACQGRLLVAAEETILLKDDRNWQDVAACTANNARYCPHTAMALYHEWFWAADLWRLITAVAEPAPLLEPMRLWCRHMIGHLVGAFDARRRSLGVAMNDSHAQVLDHLNRSCGWAFDDNPKVDVAAGMELLCSHAEALRSAWLDDGTRQAVDAEQQAASA